MEIKYVRKMICRKILKKGIVFLGITIITSFTLSLTDFLTFSIITYIWTLWAFDIFEYFTLIKIERKFKNIWSITLSLYIIIILIGLTSLSVIIDRPENENIYIAVIVSIINGILFIINTIISIKNFANILRIYYPN
jgi:biotin transporter BioY